MLLACGRNNNMFLMILNIFFPNIVFRVTDKLRVSPNTRKTFTLNWYGESTTLDSLGNGKYFTRRSIEEYKTGEGELVSLTGLSIDYATSNCFDE